MLNKHLITKIRDKLMDKVILNSTYKMEYTIF